MQEILITKMMKNDAHGNQTKCNQIMQNEISHRKLTPKYECDQHQIQTNLQGICLCMHERMEQFKWK